MLPTVPLSARERETIMGLLDFLDRTIFCPECGTKGARKKVDGTVHCPNANCPNFDPSIAELAGGSAQQPNAPSGSGSSFGGSKPGYTMVIRYQNFRGEQKAFQADPSSAQRKNHHIVVKVAPKGARIALNRDRILNLNEVESAFPRRVGPGQVWPSPRERQVLNYHKKHGSSSPLYEKIRAKYPNW